MKKSLLIVVAVALISAGTWLVYNKEADPVPFAGQERVLTRSYTNDTYRFSLKMPEEFKARSTEDSAGGEVVVLEDTVHSDTGVQITITPFDEELRELTRERIQEDAPDLTITDTQTLEIGDAYRGLAFKSDNPAFDGASREVWFVFPLVTEEGRQGHYLYQISTYERLDPLLKAIFATWQFF